MAFQVTFKGVNGSFKKVSSAFQKQKLSRMFHLSFVKQFCCCMGLIAATRAEGWLVFSVKYVR